MWKDFFDSWTLIKGEAIQDSCILRLNVTGDEINAQVKGTQIYDIRIDKHFNMSCSCPQAINRGRCKHLVCVLLKHEKNGGSDEPMLEFDYSKREERLAEILEKELAYQSQQSEYWEQRTLERERKKQERARIKAEELAERKRKREEQIKLEKARIAKEREEQRRIKLKTEENNRRRELTDKLSILGIANLSELTTDQLQIMYKEKRGEIAVKRIELANAEQERRENRLKKRIQTELKKKEKQLQEERRKNSPTYIEDVVKLTSGNKIYVPTVSKLMNALFNGTKDYRSYYFKPKEAQKFIRGGFYIWIIKEMDDGWVHDLKNGQIWKTTINESRDEIERKFLGDQRYLSDEVMDMHSCKILVFLDIRDQEEAFEFFGVFGEKQVLYLHNDFKGISYVKLSDSIEYEIEK